VFLIFATLPHNRPTPGVFALTINRVTTLPGKSWKTAKVMENDDDALEFFVKMH